MKETLFVSFSGGRTSAYMCWWLLNNKADVYDFIFIFANTGLEHENTLKFVNQCDTLVSGTIQLGDMRIFLLLYVLSAL